jgi:RimJ/RimL family protein N-acetyltransferase
LRDYNSFKLFLPDAEKLAFFMRKLMDTPLYISDDERTPEAIGNIVAYYLSDRRRNILYEVGDFGGILGFVNIIPGHKASVIFKLWDGKLWTPGFVREAREFLAENMAELYLRRLETTTADPRVVKMARLAGFEIEGIKTFDFVWDGDFYDSTILGLIAEGGTNGLLHRKGNTLEGLDESGGEGTTD